MTGVVLAPGHGLLAQRGACAHKDISTTMEIYAEATKEAKAHSFANLNGKLGISV